MRSENNEHTQVTLSIQAIFTVIYSKQETFKINGTLLTNWGKVSSPSANRNKQQDVSYAVHALANINIEILTSVSTNNKPLAFNWTTFMLCKCKGVCILYFNLFLNKKGEAKNPIHELIKINWRGGRCLKVSVVGIGFF